MLRVVIFALFALAGCSKDPDPEGLLGAAEKGDIATLSQLLDRSESVDVRDACLFTPLMKAALNGHLQAVRQLLHAGAEVNAVDKGGYTALMLAVSNNHTHVVEALLDAGADVNHVETTRGWTALIWAANLGHRDMAKILLFRGAEPAVKDYEGLTARDWAGRRDDPQLTELFRSHS
jgi:ankyrin repeat protein